MSLVISQTIMKMKMKNNLLIILTFLIISLMACSQNSLQSKRKITMLLITKCIIENDTTQLYNLIDTTFDKEGLDFDISFLHRQFIKRKITIHENSFNQIDDDGLYFKCKVIVDSKTIKYIDINFSFSPGISNKVFTINKYVETNGDDSLKSPNGEFYDKKQIK
jgi:hypothetical protein